MSEADIQKSAHKSLTIVLQESSYKGTLKEALAEYLTDINKLPTEAARKEILSSETKSNLFRLWLTENFIRPQQELPTKPANGTSVPNPELRAILATKFTDAVAIARLEPRVAEVDATALSVLLASLPEDASQDELENSLMLKLYFP